MSSYFELPAALRPYSLVSAEVFAVYKCVDFNKKLRIKKKSAEVLYRRRFERQFAVISARGNCEKV